MDAPIEEDYTLLDANLDEYRLALEDEFFKEFPELKGFLDISFYANSQTQQVGGGGANLSSDNHKYRSTEYYYKNPRNLSMEFIHFTSLQALLSILHTNSIRLSSLNSMNDPNEIGYASDLFSSPAEVIEWQKKSILSFSLCEFHSEDEEIGTNAKNLDLWRFYGGDGKGVAIKFKIHSDPATWKAYHLCGIKYGKTSLEYWRKVKTSLDKFKGKYPEFSVNWAQLLAFHKNKLYKNEQEVRLILGGHYQKNDDKLLYPQVGVSGDMYPKVEKRDSSFYSYIPLRSVNPSQALGFYFQRSPEISIEHIYLGYKFKEHELSVFKGIINKLMLASSGAELSEDKITISELNRYYR